MRECRCRSPQYSSSERSPTVVRYRSDGARPRRACPGAAIVRRPGRGHDTSGSVICRGALPRRHRRRRRDAGDPDPTTCVQGVPDDLAIVIPAAQTLLTAEALRPGKLALPASIFLPGREEVLPRRRHRRLLERSVSVVERREAAPAGGSVPFEDGVPEVQHQRQASQAPVRDGDRPVRGRGDTRQAGRRDERACADGSRALGIAFGAGEAHHDDLGPDVRREVARNGSPVRASPGPARQLHLRPRTKPRGSRSPVTAERHGVVRAPERAAPVEGEARMERVRAGSAQRLTVRRLALSTDQ